MTQRSEILGKKMFAILPDNPGSPDDPAAEGVRSLHVSLLQVLNQYGRCCASSEIRYSEAGE